MHGRALVITALVLLPVLVATGTAVGQDGCDPFADVQVPRYVAWLDEARDIGAPLALALNECAPSDHQVRVWLGQEDGTHASRTWNGTHWVASSSYVPMPTGPDAVVAVRLDADVGAADEILPGEGTLGVWARTRGPDGASAPRHLGGVTLADDPGVVGTWTEDPIARVHDNDGTLDATAPVGFDSHGRPLPPGFGLVASLGQMGRGNPEGPVPEGGILIQRFAPALDPGSWDLIELRILDQNVTTTQGIRLTDGEGTLALPHIQLHGATVVQLVHPDADGIPAPPPGQGDALRITWTEDDGDPMARPETDGHFALAKGGDTLAVTYGQTTLDTVVYGDDQASGPGWSGEPVADTRIDRRIFVRATDLDGTLTDTDSADDWTHPRIHRQHQVDRGSEWFVTEGDTRVFACPDRCWEEVELRLDAARRSVDINLYDLTLIEAVDALVAAAERGVELRVLLHDRPVAASADHMARIAWAVDELLNAGAEVRTHNGTRFDVNHAKYLVVDGTWTLVLSENAVPSGWAPDGRNGNRGWGSAVEDTALASWMTALFTDDFAHPHDTFAVTPGDFSDRIDAPFAAPVTVASDRIDTLVVPPPVRVRPVVAPDHLGDPPNSILVAALEGATDEIWTQQLNLPLDWARPGYRTTSPLILAMQDADARGVVVRGTLASAFEDGDVETDGNDRTAAVLSLLPHTDVRLGDAPHGRGVVHNKGWLVDPVPGGVNLAFVGSANGNLASQAMNREVDLVLQHPDIAAYYRGILRTDLEEADPLGTTRGPESATPTIPAPGTVALALALALLAVVVSGRRHTLLMAPARRPPRRP